MSFSISSALEYVKDNDIKFVRLAFCNLFGIQKNIAIMASELERAFEKGVRVDAPASNGFVGDDMFLFPDPSTLTMLPWRPAHSGVARLYCSMRRSDGSPRPEDGRELLRRAIGKLDKMGYKCDIGSECEFYLFQLDETGAPTLTPHDDANYCDFAPRDKGENVRREICLALMDMGIMPESSHHEREPGQNEIVLRYREPLQAADALVSFRAVTEIIAARNGLSASFNPKPFLDKHGNNVHINVSILRDGVNLFEKQGEADAESFVAGILLKLGDMTAFLNAMPESFAGNLDNARDKPIRLPSPENGFTRLELRTPDTSLSPYFALALIVEAGVWGIENKVALSDDPFGDTAPRNIEEALRAAENSFFVAEIVSDEALDAYVAQKRAELARDDRIAY
ncbi:MAG: glutamine synthetase family protein [Clostridiales bacterium]|nr:glutamine synthetase family protein [Clostridiales bacterium]